MTSTQHLPPVKRFIAIRVIPVMVILAGAGAIVVGVQTVQLARASSSWPVVEGTIIASEVHEVRSTTGPIPRTVTYRPRVQYRYSVDGAVYDGTRVSYGEYATEERADAEAVVARYRVGQAVRVHHRPDAPVESVLEAGSHGMPWFFALAGAAFVMAGLVLAWGAPRLIAPAEA